jgi:hypothetical protein
VPCVKQKERCCTDDAKEDHRVDAMLPKDVVKIRDDRYNRDYGKDPEWISAAPIPRILLFQSELKPIAKSLEALAHRPNED